jgi:hypothetical protein
MSTPRASATASRWVSRRTRRSQVALMRVPSPKRDERPEQRDQHLVVGEKRESVWSDSTSVLKARSNLARTVASARMILAVAVEARRFRCRKLERSATTKLPAPTGQRDPSGLTQVESCRPTAVMASPRFGVSVVSPCQSRRGAEGEARWSVHLRPKEASRSRFSNTAINCRRSARARAGNTACGRLKPEVVLHNLKLCQPPALEGSLQK